MLKQRALMVDAICAATPVWTFSTSANSPHPVDNARRIETGPVASDTAEKFIKNITDIP